MSEQVSYFFLTKDDERKNVKEQKSRKTGEASSYATKNPPTQKWFQNLE